MSEEGRTSTAGESDEPRRFILEAERIDRGKEKTRKVSPATYRTSR